MFQIHYMLVGDDLNNLYDKKKDNRILYYSKTNLLAFKSSNKVETESSIVTQNMRESLLEFFHF